MKFYLIKEQDFKTKQFKKHFRLNSSCKDKLIEFKHVHSHQEFYVTDELDEHNIKKVFYDRFLLCEMFDRKQFDEFDTESNYIYIQYTEEFGYIFVDEVFKISKKKGWRKAKGLHIPLLSEENEDRAKTYSLKIK